MIFILSLSGLFLSCTKEEYCLSDVVAYLDIGFYTWEDGVRVKKTIETFTACGISSDSLIYDARTNIQSVELPLSNLSDTSRFMFVFQVDMPSIPSIDRYRKYKIKDTLIVVYSRQIFFISPVCGFGYNYELLDAFATQNYIDSVIITNPYVYISDKGTEENIEILF